MEARLNLTEKLSGYIAQKRAQQLPESIIERAKIHILDTIGAMLSGSVLKPGRLIIDFVRAQGGLPEATVAASDIKTNAVLAALANSMTAHADETDDAHFSTITHPGSVIVPAALAVAEREHRSGKELISAVILGYDVLCRLSKALDRNWMEERCIQSGSVCANFGAAAAASRLLHLNESQVRFALAFAGTQASGLRTWRQDLEHIDKALCFSGVPARNGVTAALWAQAGFTATTDVFEGPENLMKAFAQQARPGELIRDLGSHYEILDTSIKKYPGGQPMQATLEGYFELVREHSLKSQDIQQILVRLPASQANTINDRPMPDINCQYLLSVAMLDGKVDFQSAHDFERMHDPDVLELKKRVRVAADPELTKKHPAIRSAIVEFTMSDGRHFQILMDRLPGAPNNPLSTEEVEDKFLLLSTPLLGESRSKSVVESVWNLEKLSDVVDLAAKLVKTDK
ncbi:MmgE/PrpD family protein [Thermodesulfobacteriota bacterium]